MNCQKQEKVLGQSMSLQGKSAMFGVAKALRNQEVGFGAEKFLPGW